MEVMRPTLFQFTMRDGAKLLSNSLRPKSIHTWVDLETQSLKKFFFAHRTISLRKQISTFIARESESFHSCWDIYVEVMNECSHHNFEVWQLVDYFYEGLTLNMKQLLESMCNEQFSSKSGKEAMEFYTYFVDLAKK